MGNSCSLCIELKLQTTNLTTGHESQPVRVFMPCQGRSKLDNWRGGGVIFIYSGSAQLIFLKSIVFMVCEHEYMNISPTPIIELATALCLV